MRDETLVVLVEATIIAKPSERTVDNPTLFGGYEAFSDLREIDRYLDTRTKILVSPILEWAAAIRSIRIYKSGRPIDPSRDAV